MARGKTEKDPTPAQIKRGLTTSVIVPDRRPDNEQYYVDARVLIRAGRGDSAVPGGKTRAKPIDAKPAGLSDGALKFEIVDLDADVLQWMSIEFTDTEFIKQYKATKIPATHFYCGTLRALYNRNLRDSDYWLEPPTPALIDAAERFLAEHEAEDTWGDILGIETKPRVDRWRG